MLKNYLRVAFRSLLMRKSYFALNIAGLATGISSCLLIFQYVFYEKTYDHAPANAARIVRLTLDSYQDGKPDWQSAAVYPAFGPNMKKDFPEVEDYCRLSKTGMMLSNDDRNIKFEEKRGYYADPSFLSIFDIKVLQGDPETALSGLDKIMLTPQMAVRYFGNDNPIGKVLVSRAAFFTKTFTVSGIFLPPPHSHLVINYLISYPTIGSYRRQFGDNSRPEETSWSWPIFYTYLLLQPGTDFEKLEAKFPAFCEKYINNLEWKKANKFHDDVHLVSLRDIHLHAHSMQEAESNGDAQTVSFLLLLAFFIIGIAWVNFINLSTARSLERAKETGVRKLTGATRFMLVKQFFTESMLVNLVAFLAALLITLIVSPWFQSITDSNLPGPFLLPAGYWLPVIVVFIAGAFLSGVYPAIVLSNFKPAVVLKGAFKNSSGGLMVRKLLIILQFTVAVMLMAGTIIVFEQLRYMQSQPLGVNINQMLVLKGAGSVKDSAYQRAYSPFKNEILRLPGVKSITASSSTMGSENDWANSVALDGSAGSNRVTLDFLGVDYDFIPAYEIELVAGRNFSGAFPSDSNGAILNETAVRMFGVKHPEEIINKKLGNRTIIGVVKDYHTEGLGKLIDPQMMILWLNTRNVYSVKVAAGGVTATIAAIRDKYSEYFPGDPFSYYFLDEAFGSQYKADKRFKLIFTIFTFIAIGIACMGLLGLSSYNVLQRTKEIGIRKVLGASVSGLLVLLSKDFIRLVVYALLIAFPLVWWVMNNWLQHYAYRIQIGWWIFIVAGVLAILIAILTISFQAIKTALANPVKSLRTE